MICYYCGDDTKHFDTVIITCNGCYTSYCIMCYNKLYSNKDNSDAVCICEYKHESKEQLITDYGLNNLDELIEHHNNNCDHSKDCQYFEGQCEIDDECECYKYYYIGLCPEHDVEENEKKLDECIFCTNDPKKRFYTDSELLYFALTIMKINKKDLLDKAIELDLIKDIVYEQT